MARKFENILETVGNTPVVRIGKLTPAHMTEAELQISRSTPSVRLEV